MSNRQLDIYHPAGQSSFDEVDDRLAHDYLESTGLEVMRELGNYGLGDFRGKAFLMDDDTVHTVNFRKHSGVATGEVRSATNGEVVSSHEHLF